LVDNGHQFESDKSESSDYSADQKFAAVIATAVISEHELASYCCDMACLLSMLNRGRRYLSLLTNPVKTVSSSWIQPDERIERKSNRWKKS
jgi:cell division inhibitor SulA